MHYLLEGLKAGWKNKRMMLVFYLVNLFFSIIVMIPFRSFLINYAGQSLSGKSLAEHFDLDFLFEFIRNNNGVVSMLTSIFLVVGSIYWLVGLLLSGGAYGVFSSGDRYSFPLFWKYAGHYFSRFVRLFLWSIPVFVIFYSIQFLENGVIRLLYGTDPYENILVWGAAIKTGLGYLGILIYYLTLDYARVYTVQTGETKMRRALWHGVKFTFRHFISTLSLSLILFLTGAVALVLYNPLADALHRPNTLVVILLLLVQQCYILFRIYLRLTLYAGQTFLHSRKNVDQTVTSPEPGYDTGALAAGMES